MNRAEHLLTCIAEECVETAKETSKALRFGLDDKLTTDPSGPRGTEGPTNREKIAAEFVDLLGAYQHAVRAGLLEDVGLDQLPSPIRDRMAAKASRIEAYLHYGARVGAVDLSDPRKPAPGHTCQCDLPILQDHGLGLQVCARCTRPARRRGCAACDRGDHQLGHAEWCRLWIDPAKEQQAAEAETEAGLRPPPGRPLTPEEQRDLEHLLMVPPGALTEKGRERLKELQAIARKAPPEPDQDRCTCPGTLPLIPTPAGWICNRCGKIATHPDG